MSVGVERERPVYEPLCRRERDGPLRRHRTKHLRAGRRLERGRTYLFQTISQFRGGASFPSPTDRGHTRRSGALKGWEEYRFPLWIRRSLREKRIGLRTSIELGLARDYRTAAEGRP